MSPWCTKIAITHSIKKLQDSSFACKHDSTRRKDPILGARSLFRGPRRKEVEGKEAPQTMTKIQDLDI